MAARGSGTEHGALPDSPVISDDGRSAGFNQSLSGDKMAETQRKSEKLPLFLRLPLQIIENI
ncbi:MAG: hypothetical protein ACYSWQ_20440 [Planctomycetota bacterium]|jgi:hypothetical protein